MSYYGIQLPEYWTGLTGRAIQRHGGKDATLLGCYLTSAPRANMIGLYRLPIGDVTDHTPLEHDDALRAFLILAEAEFAYYDPSTEVVWVCSMARYRLGLGPDRPALAEGDKKVTAARKLYEGVPANPWLFAFFKTYKSALHLEKRRGQPVKPLISPLQGAMEALGLVGKPVNRSTDPGTEDPTGKITGAARREIATGVENSTIPFAHYLRIAHQALDAEGVTTYTAGACEAFKVFCAQAHLDYDSDLARRALEAAEHARQRKAVSA